MDDKGNNPGTENEKPTEPVPHQKWKLFGKREPGKKITIEKEPIDQTTATLIVGRLALIGTILAPFITGIFGLIYNEHKVDEGVSKALQAIMTETITPILLEAQHNVETSVAGTITPMFSRLQTINAINSTATQPVVIETPIPLETNENYSIEGLSIPIRVELFEENSVQGEQLSGSYTLVSKQNFSDGYNIPDKYFKVTWKRSGNYPDINNLPMVGIISIITVKPEDEESADQIVICLYELVSEKQKNNTKISEYFRSQVHYINYDEPNIMVWDFSGIYGLNTDEKKNLGIDAYDYSELSKSIIEQWQGDYITRIYKPDSIASLSIICEVNANRVFVGENENRQYEFHGDINVDNVFVITSDLNQLK